MRLAVTHVAAFFEQGGIEVIEKKQLRQDVHRSNS